MAKKKLFRIEMKMCATAYIKATSAREALDIARTLKNKGLYTDMPEDSDIPISGRKFDDPELPNVSLSPALTCHGVWDGATPELVVDD